MNARQKKIIWTGDILPLTSVANSKYINKSWVPWLSTSLGTLDVRNSGSMPSRVAGRSWPKKVVADWFRITMLYAMRRSISSVVRLVTRVSFSYGVVTAIVRVRNSYIVNCPTPSTASPPRIRKATITHTEGVHSGLRPC